MNEHWNGIQDLLPELRKRPGMFIGSDSIFDLHTFLNGYELALNVYGIDDSLFDNDLSFHDWIALRTRFYESTSGWANMLSEFYGSEKSLEYFWLHYDEYVNRQYEIIEFAFPKSGQKWKCQVDPGTFKESYCYIRPYEVQLIKFTDDPGFFVRFLDSQGNEIDRKEYCQRRDALSFSTSALALKENDWKKNT